MSDTVIKMNSISKKIRNTVILNDLNMTVYENDIYGFISWSKMQKRQEANHMILVNDNLEF